MPLATFIKEQAHREDRVGELARYFGDEPPTDHDTGRLYLQRNGASIPLLVGWDQAWVEYLLEGESHIWGMPAREAYLEHNHPQLGRVVEGVAAVGGKAAFWAWGRSLDEASERLYALILCCIHSDQTDQ